MIRSTRILAVSLAMSFLPLALPSAASAQSKKNQEFIPGTVVTVEKEKTGRNYKMKFKRSDDEEELDVTIGPRTQLLVSVKGDEGFLKPNVFVQTRVVVTNNEFYAKDFTVILGANPQPFMKQDPAAKDVFEIGGKVTGTDPMGLMVQCSPQPRKVTFEAEKNVTVKIADPTLIKEGDSAEIEGTIVKTKKSMNAMAVNVTSETELNSDEYFASLEERKKPKSAKSKTTSKSKTEAGSDAFDETNPFKNVDKDKKKGTKAADAPKGEETNPFKDVDKKKPATKSKDEKSEGDAKKEGDKPEAEKRDAEKS